MGCGQARPVRDAAEHLRNCCRNSDSDFLGEEECDGQVHVDDSEEAIVPANWEGAEGVPAAASAKKAGAKRKGKAVAKKKGGPNVAQDRDNIYRRVSASLARQTELHEETIEKVTLLPPDRAPISRPVLIAAAIPDLGWPQAQTFGALGQRPFGWLLKRNGGKRPGPITEVIDKALLRFCCWTWRYWELRDQDLAYWESDAERDPDGAGDPRKFGPPRGVFPLEEMDGVDIRGQVVTIHFAMLQQTGTRKKPRAVLRLRANSSHEAERWCASVRAAAAARLRDRLPAEWDVSSMLVASSSPQVRLVAEVPLPEGWVTAMQRLLDFTYICKRTKDRKDREVPVRLEVQRVIGIQNFAAWVKYTKARSAVGARVAHFDQMNIQGWSKKLEPDVLTKLHGDNVVHAALGEPDTSANENWLFHGTSAAGVQGIAHKDFRLDLAGSNRGTLYGKGLYLAECCSKADEYAEADEEGICRMLVCRASLGRILVDSAAKPDSQELMQRVSSEGYDSLCGDRWAAVGTYREFVLFNQGLVYPAYIILYKRRRQIELLTSVGNACSQGEDDNIKTLVPLAARLAEMHPDPVVRFRVTMLLGAHLPKVTPVLAESTRDSRPRVRRTACIILGQMGTHSTSAMEEAGATKSLNEDQEAVRQVVAAAAVPALTASLKDPVPDVRRAAATALSHYGARAASAVSGLVECIEDEDKRTRQAVVKSLGQLVGRLRNAAADLPAVACILQKGLKDEDADVRKSVAISLGQIGIHAVPTIGALTEALSDSNEEVRTRTAAVLGALPPSTVVGALEPLLINLSDESVDVREATAVAIGNLGSLVASQSVAEAVAVLFADLSGGVRKAALAAVGNFGEHAAPLVQQVAKLLRDAENEVQLQAANTLGKLGTYAATSVPALCSVLRENNEQLRRAAVLALGEMGESAAPALPAMCERIKDSSAGVRKAAASALGSLGAHAAPAVPLLEMLLDDAFEQVRLLAGIAHRSIIISMSAGIEMEEMPPAANMKEEYNRWVKSRCRTASEMKHLERVRAIVSQKADRGAADDSDEESSCGSCSGSSDHDEGSYVPSNGHERVLRILRKARDREAGTETSRSPPASQTSAVDMASNARSSGVSIDAKQVKPSSAKVTAPSKKTVKQARSEDSARSFTLPDNFVNVANNFSQNA
eukprot:TRINITY_DN31300_c0_g3_i1.p1 TRINITY_DN31300_c0_g3~~TRINITY_DN31300_c0_g3_i1.p1  ORF type:complete len:1166 (-),score=232.78 TRINITY_DN31300_c0_g3_i1:168-3665(-)